MDTGKRHSLVVDNIPLHADIPDSSLAGNAWLSTVASACDQYAETTYLN
jgi:hypothetical protein